MPGGRPRLSPEEKQRRQEGRAKEKQKCEGCGRRLGKTQLWLHKTLRKCGTWGNATDTGGMPSSSAPTDKSSGQANGTTSASDRTELEESCSTEEPSRIADNSPAAGATQSDSMDVDDIADTFHPLEDVHNEPLHHTIPSESSHTAGPTLSRADGDLTLQSRDDDGTPGVPVPEPGSLDDMALQDEQNHPAQDIDHGQDHQAAQPPEDLLEPTVIHLEDLKVAQDFIEGLRTATLETTKDTDLLHRLRNPPTSELHLDDPITRQSLEIYLEDVTEATYEHIRTSLKRINNISLLSHARIKKVVEEISGVVPVYNDMCIKGCLAFVGPFAKYSRCPKCGEQRYDPYVLASKGHKKPRQQFVTIPVGPQVQAAYRSAESATDMNYRAQCTRAVMESITAGEAISEWADYIHGTSYLEAVLANDIKDTTTVLMGSLDGAQLYRMKTSDCWIYIWVLLDRSPGTRYKKKHVLVGGVIPGPDKPGNIDSFLFPGLYHLSALMHEGLKIWDARRDILFTSYPFLAFMTADGPGMTEINGLVGHSGAQGCRLYCGIKGRHKPDVGHYYPACLKPTDYTVEGCSHDDVQLDIITSPGPQNDTIDRYEQNLKTVLSSVTQRSYRQNRLATGISKPSIVSGLPPSSVFSIPGCFPGDLMHLAALNIPDLLLSLWRGTISCDRHLGDDKSTWDWAVFQDDALWKRHGAQVAAATPYLPGSFDRPPRNPAEKLTSGYKAMEFLTYIYGLGPGLLYGVLPMPHWKSFCKLVRGVRVVHQKTLKKEELTEADRLLLQFCIEFEQLYYQRNPARIHFVRQSIHALAHLASETTRIGPYAGVTQWTMENTIGNLGREIQQPSNPYANLSQRAIRRCQVNALKAMLPELDPPKPLPQCAEDLGGGYVLLAKRERIARLATVTEATALREFVVHQRIPASNDWLEKPHISRWARLRLPTGQVARSLWKEEGTPLTRLRMSRNVKVMRDGRVDFAEVRYYFKMQIPEGSELKDKVFAMAHFYGAPDADLLEASSNTLWSCLKQTEETGLQVIDVTDIRSVVAMVPHPPLENVALGDFTGRLFVVEKMGLDTLILIGAEEEAEDLDLEE